MNKNDLSLPMCLYITKTRLLVVITMATPEYANDFFAESLVAFSLVFGAPNDDNVKRLYEAFVNVRSQKQTCGEVV